MAFSNSRAALMLAGALVAALTACNGTGAVPSSQTGAASGPQQSGGARSFGVHRADNTSILKLLTKDVVIGSTVDPKNGDTGPREISMVQVNGAGLKQGQLTVCNFDNSAGTAGQGTTIELFNPTPSSSPKSLATSTDIEGCAGDATTSGNKIFAGGMTSGDLVEFSSKGKVLKVYGSPLKAPIAVADAHCPVGTSSCLYNAEYIFTSDVGTGGITSFSINNYGNHKLTEVGSGFSVSGSGWSALGPTGIQYEYSTDNLYIADGVDSVIDAFTHASELLVANEIVVQPGGKTFQCKYPSTTCGKVIYSGKQVKSPVAMALLPNGNLIVANSKGTANKLVEITAAGTVLDTKVIDTSKTQGVYGLLAAGMSDSSTVLFYTDRNTNTLHELEQ